MRAPSTYWKEEIAPDEDARFARQRLLLAAAHAVKNKTYGKGRLLHRKELLGADATFEVYADLPDFARHGIFAVSGVYPAIVRLSNGAFDVQANTKPDIRGFAVKILGQSGPAALGGDADHQDFLLINHDHFASRNSDDFVEFVGLAAQGELSAFWTLFRRHGLSGLLARLKSLGQTLRKPFKGYAYETFNTVLPHRVGPYAAKLLLRPLAPAAMAGSDAGEDIRRRLAAGPIAYDILLQFYVSDALTSIENHATAWSETDVPPLSVGRLTLTAIRQGVETLAFDPWSGLDAHRPLGEIMRARKGAYRQSQQARA